MLNRRSTHTPTQAGTSRIRPARLQFASAFALCAGALCTAALPACAREAEPHAPEPYLRVQEDADSGAVNLQIALRTFSRGEDEPTLTLVGVAHVGESSYYESLEARLDAHDLVLFEGVGPIWARVDPDAPQADLIAATRSRIRLVAIAAAQREAAGQPVRTIADTYAGATGYEARLIRAAGVDAWGNPLRFEPTDEGLRIESLGADGVPGGRGANADIAMADMPALVKEELEAGDGIQSQLAGAAGLVFQLTAMDYDKPHWVNSDTTAEALGYALAGMDPKDARPGGGGPPAAGGGDPLFDLMSGRGMLGKLAGGLLKFIGASPQSRAMLRLMLIETLANADEMMDLAGGLGGEEGGMGRMMDVLINQRNEVVLTDIRNAIRDAKAAEVPVEDIAIFYGAGHLLEMERSLVEMGFRPTGTQWLDAIGVSPESTGMSKAQLTQMRTMMSRMIESQTKMLRDMQE